MPAAFNRCRRGGGRIRTKVLSGGRYMHVCILSGKTYAGHIKKKQKKSQRAGRP